MQVLPTQHILQNALRENSDYGFIYLNNPKVGCSTIKSNLWAGVRGKAPARDAQVHQLPGSPFANVLPEPEAAKRAFVFTFVRNPFQRLVSAYLNKVESRTDQVWNGFASRRGLDPTAKVGFDQFVEVICGHPPEDNDPHWRPQHFNALYPLVTPNVVADLESLDALLPQILTRIFGVAAPVMSQRRSHSTLARASWRSYFADAGTWARVRRVYEADCAAFGYADTLDADAKSSALPRQSDQDHAGLARLAAYVQAEPGAQVAALNGLTDAALQDWVLGQRMRRPRLHQTTLDTLMQRHAAQIAGSAYLRKVVAGLAAQG